MLVILARHGNTFSPGETAVWVGGRTDLPLVEKGRAQAEAIGRALRDAGLRPARTIAGPLRRTRDTAAIALAAAGLDPGAVTIDERLREIDYGRWEAKSSTEIRAMGDGALLAAWEERGEWPEAAAWQGSRSSIVAGFEAVLDELKQQDGGPALIVSSNGIFRMAATAMKSHSDLGSGKMATGALSALRVSKAKVEPIFWNIAPEKLLTITRSEEP